MFQKTQQSVQPSWQTVTTQSIWSLLSTQNRHKTHAHTRLVFIDGMV